MVTLYTFGVRKQPKNEKISLTKCTNNPPRFLGFVVQFVKGYRDCYLVQSAQKTRGYILGVVQFAQLQTAGPGYNFPRNKIFELPKTSQ
jgi:hypothetical protein